MVNPALYVLLSAPLARLWSRRTIDALDELGVGNLRLVLSRNLIPVVFVSVLSFGSILRHNLIKAKSVL